MAQLVRAPPCHGGGHGFESRLGRTRPRDCPNEVREGSHGHERKRVMCDCEAAPKLAKQGLQDLRSNEQGLTLVLSGDCPSEVKHNLMKGCVFCF